MLLSVVAAGEKAIGGHFFIFRDRLLFFCFLSQQVREEEGARFFLVGVIKEETVAQQFPPLQESEWNGGGKTSNENGGMKGEYTRCSLEGS